jgi:hypothetical protein
MKKLGFIFIIISLYACSGADDSELSRSDSGGSGNEFALFESDLHPILKKNCGMCHGASQAPQFAVDSSTEAFETINSAKLIDYANSDNSRFLEKLGTNHQCGTPEECSKLIETVKPIIASLVEAKNSSEEGGAPDVENATSEMSLSDAVKKSHAVPRPSYLVYEAEKYSNSDVDISFDASPTSVVDYITPKEAEEGEEVNPLIHKRAATGDVGVRIDTVDQGSFGDKFENTGGEWKWSVFNTNESLIEVGGSTSIILSPSAGIGIDKIILVPFEVEEPELTRNVLSFDLSSLVGVAASIDVVAEADDKGNYLVGQPVISSQHKIYFKKMRVYFNGENKTNEATFDLIDKTSQPGVFVLDSSVQAIPFTDGESKSSDKIFLSFEEIRLIE